MAAEQDSEAKGIQVITINEDSIGDNNIVAAISGQSVYILALSLSANGGVNTVSLRDTGGAVQRSPIWDFADNGFMTMPHAPKGRWWAKSVEGTGIDLELSAATIVSGVMVYQQF